MELQRSKTKIKTKRNQELETKKKHTKKYRTKEQSN